MRKMQKNAPIWRWTKIFWEFQYKNLSGQSPEQLNDCVYLYTFQTLHLLWAVCGWNHLKLCQMPRGQPCSSWAISLTERKRGVLQKDVIAGTDVIGSSAPCHASIGSAFLLNKIKKEWTRLSSRGQTQDDKWTIKRHSLTRNQSAS